MKSNSFQITHLSADQLRLLNAQLEKLHREVGARCVILASSDGHLITHSGSLEYFPTHQIIPLLVGSISGAVDTGKILDKNSDLVNLIYLESKNEYLYAISVSSQLILIIVIDHTPFSSRLGTVWYSSRKSASELINILHQSPSDQTTPVLDANVIESIGDELDKLLGGGNISPDTNPPDTPTKQSPS